jgi:hypothetical protein
MLLNGLTLAEHGAQLFPAAIRAQFKDLLALLEALPSDQAGIRINAWRPSARRLPWQSAMWMVK